MVDAIALLLRHMVEMRRGDSSYGYDLGQQGQFEALLVHRARGAGAARRAAWRKVQDSWNQAMWLISRSTALTISRYGPINSADDKSSVKRPVR